MYDTRNWLQVWLSMPGTAIQSAALFWFRIDTPSPAFPSAGILTGDAARFFAGSIGYTSQNLNFFAYVRVFAFIDIGGLLVTPHGESTFPGIPPMPEPLMPSCSTLTVRPIITPRIKQAHWSMGRTPRSWITDGHPNINADIWLTAASVVFPSGFGSQGRHFTPVVVSYKNREWYDIERLEMSPRLGGRHRRLQPRADRLIGNFPKILL